MKEQPVVRKAKELLKSKGIVMYNFNIILGTGEACGCIADVLEKNVDEKYYINPRLYEHLTIKTNENKKDI